MVPETASCALALQQQHEIGGVSEFLDFPARQHDDRGPEIARGPGLHARR
jgi:hypothetical protein